MNWLDKLTENVSRNVAKTSSRRGFLGAVGGMIAGASFLPLLPVARAQTAQQPGPPAADPGDPTTCEYWRNCAIDGYLCSCCGHDRVMLGSDYPFPIGDAEPLRVIEAAGMNESQKEMILGQTAARLFS